VTSSKSGVSALGLKRELGLASYQTTWRLLHKLRRAMVRPARDQLAGVVEVDETYVGGVEVGVAGRETRTKSIVVVAVEVIDDRRAGRIRLGTVPNVGVAGLRPFVERAVAPGSEIRTDAWAGYSFLDRPNPAGGKPAYQHAVINVSASGDPAHVSLPHVHRVASLLKRWQLGTHQGSVTREHLDYYLDEFTFRFNRRTAKHPGLLFHRLLEQAVQIPPTRHAEIVGGTTLQSGLRGRRRAPRPILGNAAPCDYFSAGIDDSDPPF
jgi:hypothetical protein